MNNNSNQPPYSYSDATFRWQIPGVTSIIPESLDDFISTPIDEFGEKEHSIHSVIVGYSYLYNLKLIYDETPQYKSLNKYSSESNDSKAISEKIKVLNRAHLHIETLLEISEIVLKSAKEAHDTDAYQSVYDDLRHLVRPLLINENGTINSNLRDLDKAKYMTLDKKEPFEWNENEFNKIICSYIGSISSTVNFLIKDANKAITNCFSISNYNNKLSIYLSPNGKRCYAIMYVYSDLGKIERYFTLSGIKGNSKTRNTFNIFLTTFPELTGYKLIYDDPQDLNNVEYVDSEGQLVKYSSSDLTCSKNKRHYSCCERKNYSKIDTLNNVHVFEMYVKFYPCRYCVLHTNFYCKFYPGSTIYCGQQYKIIDKDHQCSYD